MSLVVTKRTFNYKNDEKMFIEFNIKQEECLPNMVLVEGKH